MTCDSSNSRIILSRSGEIEHIPLLHILDNFLFLPSSIYRLVKLACLLSRLSCVQPFVMLWTDVLQALLPMGFSRQEYWSGLPCSPPGDLPNTAIESTSHLEHWQVGFIPIVPPGQPMDLSYTAFIMLSYITYTPF